MSTTSRSGTNCLRARDQHAVLVEHERRPVEDELVLAADEVRVDDRHRRVGRARGQHRLPFDEALRVVRRRVEVDDEPGAARGLGEDRPGRAPRVLADRHAHAHARDVEQRAVARAGRRSTAARRRPRSWGAAACGRRRTHDRSRTPPPRCRDRGPGSGNPMTAAARAGAGRDLVERLDGLRDERGPEEQILGRVAGDRELGEHDEVATGGLGLLVRRRGCAPRCPRDRRRRRSPERRRPGNAACTQDTRGPGVPHSPG